MLVQNFNQMMGVGYGAGTNNFHTIDNDYISHYNGNFNTMVGGFTALTTQKVSGSAYDTSTFSIGSGSTEIAKDDYKLDVPIDETSFSIVGTNKTYNGSSVVLSQTWSYSGNSEITINEIGLFEFIMNTNGAKKPCLMAREVLDSPITVSNGDTFTISMVIG